MERQERTPEDPLGAWIEAAKSGEPGAWERLYRRYRGLLLVAIRSQGVPLGMRSRFDTEDVLQSSFLSAFRALPDHEFQGEPSFRAWLRRIATNKLQDRLRHNSRDRRNAAHESGPPDGTALGTEDSPSVNFERVEVQERVLDGLTRLSEDDQELVCWKTLERYSFADIARFLECSESTARRRYLDAIRRLQEILRESSPDSGTRGSATPEEPAE